MTVLNTAHLHVTDILIKNWGQK